MPTFESPEYERTRLRLVADPVVQDMARGCRGLHRDTMAHPGPDGGPRHEFMLASLRRYEELAGHPAESHIGGVAEAILRLLDWPGGEAAWPGRPDDPEATP